MISSEQVCHLPHTLGKDTDECHGEKWAAEWDEQHCIEGEDDSTADELKRWNECLQAGFGNQSR